ncbi:hypothetical protein EUX98_g3288 [Antrodiella citrinella]|uniref:N-acetyltransferase domain-containing protein n=1 Tax=Antrodiella citrinella TaxID=2447956 RepID=A0A4S4MWX2_9APHY|nr:hypothetical protein EUX98_g3288 [Antrodiella citrinella]
MQWWSEFLPRYSAVANAITGPGVKLASWVIHCLAVDPNFRGRGAGRALVESAECLAKKDRLPVIFETESERNIQLYQYWGYEILGQQALEMGEDNLVLTVFKKDFSKV